MDMAVHLCYDYTAIEGITVMVKKASEGEILYDVIGYIIYDFINEYNWVLNGIIRLIMANPLCTLTVPSVQLLIKARPHIRIPKKNEITWR